MIDAVGDQLESITLVRGFKGQFEVDVDGKEVFSKRAAGRHANPGEVAQIVQAGHNPPTQHDGGRFAGPAG